MHLVVFDSSVTGDDGVWSRGGGGDDDVAVRLSKAQGTGRRLCGHVKDANILC